MYYFIHVHQYPYIFINFSLKWPISESQAKFGESKTSGNVEKRLLLIPLVFILLRIWGTIQFFFSIATSELNEEGCVPNWVATIYFMLGLLQVQYYIC